MVADKISIDEEGTKSYYLTYNQYLTGGWVGSTVRQDEAGQYGSDPRTGENYYWQHHSAKGQQAYYQMQTQIISKGYLIKYYFAKPTFQTLQYYSQNGYTVEVTTNYIKVWNSEIRYTWLLDSTEFIIENITNSVVTSTTITKYKYNIQYGQYLKYKVTTTTPQTFENGDCFDHITEVTYSDYTTTCTDSENRTSKLKSNNVFSVFPNPTSDYLTVNIPLSEKATQINILSTSGQIILHMIINENDTAAIVDVNGIPPGIYFISMNQGAQVENLKFVKL
jgi:hypothetical protein